jgi:signal transduction histidine kinase
MLMPASSEFVSLCRSQVILVTEGLGASLSAVYLTEDLADSPDAKLIPIVVYPEEAVPWSESIPLRLPVNVDETQSYLPLANPTTPSNSFGGQQPERTLVSEDSTSLPQDVASTSDASNSAKAEALPLSLLGQQRIVLPLIHEGIVLGLLVTSREDRQWYEWEQVQLEQVARTLAIACILDQRYQWLEHSAYEQGLTQAQQRDTLKNLLHQFRNPLTALRTFGKLLLKRLRPEDANHEVANSIVRESDRLQALLQQFDAAIDLGQAELDFDRAASSLNLKRLLPLAPDWQPSTPEGVPAGVTLPTQPLLPPSGLIIGTHLPLEPCFVSQILEPLLISASAIAQERQLDLQADIPTDLPPVQANNLALQEVFSNLMDNALKYTPKGGQISVRVSQNRSDSSNYQVITVSDTGPGIPPGDLNHVFERHYRGVQAQTDIPGTGLGLAIARELVEQMQGKIQAFSPALETAREQAIWGSLGSTFAVWLPEMQHSNH